MRVIHRGFGCPLLSGAVSCATPTVRRPARAFVADIPRILNMRSLRRSGSASSSASGSTALITGLRPPTLWSICLSRRRLGVAWRSRLFPSPSLAAASG
eukprot:5790086-Prymnesium_polylepis.1